MIVVVCSEASETRFEAAKESSSVCAGPGGVASILWTLRPYRWSKAVRTVNLLSASAGAGLNCAKPRRVAAKSKNILLLSRAELLARGSKKPTRPAARPCGPSFS